MTDRILKILDNVRYWETCPEDYKKDIETFLEAQNQALRIPDVSNPVIQEIERRRDLILSEPEGIVREQMINNLAFEL